MHPLPPSSIHFHPAHFNLQPAHFSLLPALFYPIARYWAISPNFGRKIKSCPFWLKIGTHGILEVLIPNPNLDFWNFDHKNHFRATLGQKFKAVRFVWKLVHVVSQGCDSESRLRSLKFRPQNPFLGKFGSKNSKLSILSENWYTWYLKDADSYSNISFLNFKS